MTLTAGQNENFDFALQAGVVKWSDMSYSQAAKLWPDAPGKSQADVALLRLPRISEQDGVAPAR